MAPSLAESGGVRSVVKFLVDNLKTQQDRYEVELISLATSFKDVNSRRLLNPLTWLNAPQVTVDQLWGLDLYRVGCNFPELEFQRYKPRQVLDDLVIKYDVVQLVCGLPFWGNIAHNWQVPMCMQVATLTKLERAAGSASGGFLPIKVLRKLMTGISIKMDHSGVQYAKIVLHENEIFERWMDESVPSVEKLFAPPGIDVSVFQKESHVETEVDGKYMINVGRLNDRRKDTPMLVRAYAKYLEKAGEDPLKLVIAGKNNPVPELEQTIRKLNLQSHIQILQDVEYSHLLALYNHAEFFVLSSKEEGLGIVVMEAMAAGLPVISTRCGGPTSLIDEGETGFFVEIGDDSELANKMMQLAKDTDLRDRMSDNSLASSVDFDNEVRIEPYLGVYEKLSS